MQINTRVIIALVLSMIFWALSFVWINIAYESFLPLTTIFFRLLISSSILLPVFGLLRKIQFVRKEDRKWFIILAFFEPFIYFMGEGFGLQKVSPTLGAVIISTIPLLTPMAAFLVYGEKMTIWNIAGLMISFIGVLTMVLKVDLSFEATTDGLALMMLAVLSAVCYTTLLKKLTTRYNPFTIITLQNSIGLLMFLPFFLFFEGESLLQVSPSMRSLTSLFLLAVFASSMAFILFTYAIQWVGINVSNMFTNTIPVFTAIFAWLLLDELLPVRKIAGILIVVAGLFISQLKIRKNAV